MQRGMRKPGEPIYLRRHIVRSPSQWAYRLSCCSSIRSTWGRSASVCRSGFVILVSVLAGVGLYLTYRSSAQNQP